MILLQAEKQDIINMLSSLNPPIEVIDEFESNSLGESIDLDWQWNLEELNKLNEINLLVMYTTIKHHNKHIKDKLLF